MSMRASFEELKFILFNILCGSCIELLLSLVGGDNVFNVDWFVKLVKL